MSMNSQIRSFIHQHNSNLGKNAPADTRGHPAGSYGGDGTKTPRKSPSEKRQERAESSSTQTKFQCIKSKREAQSSKAGPRMFPLNQCTNFALHDTKHSVRMSVKYAVQDYASKSKQVDSSDELESSYTEEMEEPVKNYTTQPQPSIAEDIERAENFDSSSDMDLSCSPMNLQSSNQYLDTSIYDLGSGRSCTQEVRGSSDSVNSMPSISSLKPGSNSDESSITCGFNKMLNEKMSVYIQEKFAQSHLKKTLTSFEKKAETEAIEEAVIFCTNLFLQEFKSSDPGVICKDFHELRECGELKELLHDIFRDLIEKIESSNFDQFQDFVIESMTSNRASQKTENPEIYDKFVGIWALNNESFLEIDLEILLMYCDSGQERQFSYFTSAERFYNELEEAAVRMNLVKFFYTYKWELVKQRKKKVDRNNILNDLDHMQDLLADGIDNYSKDLQKQMGHLRIRDDPGNKTTDTQSKSLEYVDSNSSNQADSLCTSARKKKSLRFTDEVCVG